MSPHEIYIVHLSWGSDGKVRPVLVFLADESTISVYRITSRYESKSEEVRASYFKINDLSHAGLDRPSFIDTGTLITLPINALEGKSPVGKLTVADKQRLAEFFSQC